LIFAGGGCGASNHEEAEPPPFRAAETAARLLVDEPPRVIDDPDVVADFSEPPEAGVGEVGGGAQPPSVCNDGGARQDIVTARWIEIQNDWVKAPSTTQLGLALRNAAPAALGVRAYAVVGNGSTSQESPLHDDAIDIDAG